MQNITRLGDYADSFPEFDFRTLGDGRSASARYANNSNYRNDSLIRKESTFGSYHYMVIADRVQCA